MLTPRDLSQGIWLSPPHPAPLELSPPAACAAPRVLSPPSLLRLWPAWPCRAAKRGPGLASLSPPGCPTRDLLSTPMYADTLTYSPVLTCMHTHSYTHIHLCLHACTHIALCSHAHTQTHIPCVHMHVHTHTPVLTCMYTHSPVLTCTHTNSHTLCSHACTHSYTCAYMRVHT